MALFNQVGKDDIISCEKFALVSIFLYLFFFLLY